MSKIPKKDLEKLLEAGLITQEAFEKAISTGVASGGERTRSGKVRVIPGTNIIPSMYFKNAQGVEDTEGMVALRQEVKEAIEKYTEEVVTASLVKDAPEPADDEAKTEDEETDKELDNSDDFE